MESWQKILEKDEKTVTSKEIITGIKRLNKFLEKAYTDLGNFEAALSIKKEAALAGKNSVTGIRDLNSRLDKIRNKIGIFNVAELKLKLLFKNACNNETKARIAALDQELSKIDRTWFESSLKIVKICGQVRQAIYHINMANSLPIGTRTIPDMQSGESLESYLNQLDAATVKNKGRLN